MTVSFVGHASINSSVKLRDEIKRRICNSINSGFKTFYIGGYGDFDNLCAIACRELKREYKEIEVIYVMPYITLSEQAKAREMKEYGLCDFFLYPPIEGTPPRFALSKRNEWMVTNSDLIIAYVNRSYGGAYKSLLAARRKHKQIINIYELI